MGNRNMKIKKLLDDTAADNPYPQDIFAEPTSEEWKKLQNAVSNAGLIQDRFFGSFGRKVWDNCLQKIKEKLKDS
jgi:hypothetical protein